MFDYPEQIDAWNNRWTGFQPATDGIVSSLTPDALVGVHLVGG